MKHELRLKVSFASDIPGIGQDVMTDLMESVADVLDKDESIDDLSVSGYTNVAPKGLVYIAGPYSKGDQVLNVRRAVEAAEEVAERCDSWVPIVPHLSMLWHAMSPHDVYYWYGYGLSLVACCHAVLRLPGESRGTEMEFARAVERGIPVVDSVDELLGLR